MLMKYVRDELNYINYSNYVYNVAQELPLKYKKFNILVLDPKVFTERCVMVMIL